MRLEALAEYEGKNVRATITAPIKRGRAYVVETSAHDGILRVLGNGVSIGRVATMAAYVDSVEVVEAQ